MAIADLQPKVVFDGQGGDGSLGNRLESTSLATKGSAIAFAHLRPLYPAVKIDNLLVARPMAPEKGAGSRERKIYPSEVGHVASFSVAAVQRSDLSLFRSLANG